MQYTQFSTPHHQVLLSSFPPKLPVMLFIPTSKQKLINSHIIEVRVALGFSVNDTFIKL